MKFLSYCWLFLTISAAQAEVFSPETFTLDNGLQVVVISNHRAPVVSHMLWYKVGAADEVLGKSGLAHYLEHLMFKGTKKQKSGLFSAIIAENGGEDNAATSHDYTFYYQNIAVNRLPLVMKMEADRMHNLSLTDRVTLPERDVVLEERRQRTENQPSTRLAEQTGAALYSNHTYGIPVIGWKHEMEQLNTQTAKDFYRKWYAPNNAILIVSGDITAAELRPLAQKTYGRIPSRPVPTRQRPMEPPLTVEKRVILRDPQVKQLSYTRYYHAPTSRSSHSPALDVLSEIMGGGMSARFYQFLVFEQKAATSAGFWYWGDRLDYGKIGLSVTPVPGSTVANIETLIQQVLNKLFTEGVTEQEVKAAKERLLNAAIFARDSLRTPAYVFGIALTAGQTIDDVENWPDRIRSVTLEEVNKAAILFLKEVGYVVGILKPLKEEQK